MSKPKSPPPPPWLRVLVTIPTVFARGGGGIIAMSFMAPDEVTSDLSWLYRFDRYIGLWFMFEFAVRTAMAKAWQAYA